MSLSVLFIVMAKLTGLAKRTIFCLLKRAQLSLLQSTKLYKLAHCPTQLSKFSTSQLIHRAFTEGGIIKMHGASQNQTKRSSLTFSVYGKSNCTPIYGYYNGILKMKEITLKRVLFLC